MVVACAQGAGKMRHRWSDVPPYHGLVSFRFSSTTIALVCTEEEEKKRQDKRFVDEYKSGNDAMFPTAGVYTPRKGVSAEIGRYEEGTMRHIATGSVP